MTTTLRLTVATAVLAGTTLVSAAGGAVAGSLITSADIKDRTIKAVDLSPATVRSFQRLTGYVQVTDSEPVPANQSGGASVDCPGRKAPLGVSGYLSGGNEGVQTAFKPGGGNVYVDNVGGAATVYIQVTCATVR